MRTPCVAVLASFAAIFSFAGGARAQQHSISVGPAHVRQSVISMPAYQTAPALARSAESIRRVVDKNLRWMSGQFKMSETQPDFVVQASLSGGGQQASLEGRVSDATSKRQLLARRYTITGSTTVEAVGNRFANDIVEAMTGLPGIFDTKIAMSCARGATKEIYIMDFDGSNVMRITQHGSTAISPAWSPDGTRLAYTVTAKNRRNIKVWQLREFDFRDNTDKLLSDRPGMNSGAAYSPDGRSIAFTTGLFGNPQIVLLDPGAKRFIRLTNDPAEDIDPAWSPDGKELAFASTRSGGSMIYKMTPWGGRLTRLTFAGAINTSPAWSPRGDKLAFASWQKGRPDIYLMTAGGAGIERLTKGEGANEDPVFSPDGNLIAFSSDRASRERAIYVMDVDGSGVRRLTLGLGNCSAPKWSQVPGRPVGQLPLGRR